MARLGKRERMAKRALCVRNQAIVQHNLTHGVTDQSKSVVRRFNGELIVVSGSGTSSDHHVRLKAHAQTLGFRETRAKLRAVDKAFLKR